MLARLLKYWFPITAAASMIFAGGVFSQRISSVEIAVAAKANAADVQSRQLADDKALDEFRQRMEESLASLNTNTSKMATDLSFIKGELSAFAQAQSENLKGRNP